MMRSAVLFALLSAAVGIRLRLEEDTLAPFEEEDQDEVQAAVDEELTFAQTEGDFTVTGDQLKEKEGEEGLEESDSAVTTVQAGAHGEIKCQNCRGDPSDMVKPFWRFSKRTERVGGRAVNSFTVPAKTHFWNAKQTTQCLKDKYVLFLGDSTIVENLNDIILLLAGGPKKVNPGQFYQAVTHQAHNGELKFNTAAGEMVNTYMARNRNQTVSLPGLNLQIKYRFTGAVKLSGNCGGLQVMLEDKVREEVDELVKNGGRKPDAIVIHSAAHDMCHAQLTKDHLTGFYGSIDKVGNDLIKPWVEQGINVIWRGSYRFPNEEQSIETPKLGDYRIPAKLDYLAKKTMKKHGAKYVDIPDLIANVHDESGCCSTIGATTATFPHLGAVSIYHNARAATFLSQLASYKILDAICPAL